MDELVKIIEEMGIPFAYDHFAEGESPDPPFLHDISQADVQADISLGNVL